MKHRDQKLKKRVISDYLSGVGTYRQPQSKKVTKAYCWEKAVFDDAGVFQSNMP